MNYFDVFNGDADGLCALHQLRLEDPREARLYTGVKRDNALLRRVVNANSGDLVTVLDISLAHNREALQHLLTAGVRVRYFDHHYAGTLPEHPLFEAHIDLSPEVCTSALVDRHLEGRQRLWAVVGAYGDGMIQLAEKLSESRGVSLAERIRLRELGEALNYNAYGTTVEDLLYAPDELYRLLSPYRDPLRFIASESAAVRLKVAREADMALARALPPEVRRPGWTLHRLPDAPWSRRVMGVFANHLAMAEPGTAHALLVPRKTGDWMVSLRVPAAAPIGADEFCRQFGGSGRRTAAGIDGLGAGAVARFIGSLAETYQCPNLPSGH